MGSTAGQSLVILQFLLNAGWVLLPLAPAILIYRIFPNTETGLKGPFGNLSIRASGAFAAYFIVFLATFPLLNEMNRNLKGQFRPSWTVKGRILPQDENGNAITSSDQFGNVIRVSLDPDIVRVKPNLTFEATVPVINGRLPEFSINYEGVGTSYMDFQNLSAGDDVDFDEKNREVTIRSPIIIRKEPCIGIDCSSEQLP
jgi:hypothetical protein